MSIIKYALILLVAVAGLAFHGRNGQLILVDFYLVSYEIPLSLALAAALLAGALLAVLSALPSWLKLKRDKAKLGRQLKARQAELQASEEQSADIDAAAGDAPLLKTSKPAPAVVSRGAWMSADKKHKA